MLRTAAKSVQQNFDLVSVPLKKLSLSFDPAAIQSRKPGAALKLLYALKLKLEGTKSLSPDRRAQDPGHPSPAQRQAGTLVGKDWANQLLEKKLEKFQDAKRKLDQHAYESMAREKELKAQTVRTSIVAQNQTLRENRQFMKEWTQKGMQNWYKNQQKLKMRSEKERLFEQTAVDRYKTVVTKTKEAGAQEVREGIDGFERNLQKLGIDIQEQAVDEDEAADSAKKKKKQPFSIVSAMTKIREKKTLADFSRKEKDRRRRKTQVDQTRTQTEIERQYKEEDMLARLRKDAERSRALCYHKWRAGECRGLLDGLARGVEMDRQHRAKKQMSDYLRAKEIENQEYDKKRKADLQVSRKKFAESEKQLKLKRRALYGKVVHQTLITQLLDIANEAYKKQLASDTKQIDSKAWEGWMKSFVSGEDIVPGGVTAYVAQSHTKTGWAKDNSFASDPELERYEMLDYVCNLGLWDPQLVVREASAIGAECEEADPPLQVAGDPKSLAAEESRLWKWFQSAVASASSPEKSPTTIKDNSVGYIPVKLALGGKRFTAKKGLAKVLEAKYGFNVFRPAGEIKRITKIVEAERKAKEEKKEEKKEDAKGKPVPKAKVEAKKDPKKEEAPPQVDPALREIVEKIMKLRTESAEPDTRALNRLQTDFVVTWLRQAYPKSATDYRRELKERLRRKREVEAELQRMQEEAAAKKGGKVNQKKEQELTSELAELNKPGEKSFVIVGFPQNAEQAQEFQAALGQEAEVRQRTEAEGKSAGELKAAKLLSGRIEAPERISWKAECVLDGFVLLDITKAECKARGGSRRKHPETGEFFYGGNLPADKQEAEKLQDAKLQPDTLERAYWKSAAADKEMARVEDYYCRFAPKRVGELTQTVWHRVNGASPDQDIEKEVGALIESWNGMQHAKEEGLVAELEAEITKELEQAAAEEEQEEKKEEKKKKEKEKEEKKGETKMATEDKKEAQPTEPAKQTSEEEKTVASPAKSPERSAKEYALENLVDAWNKVKEKYPDSMHIIFKFYRKQKYPSCVTWHILDRC